MKSKIIMTKGLPASGKSTWAREMCAQGYKRVNKDDLRVMIDDGKWSKGNEKFVLLMRDFMVRNAIKQGHSIIVDDTNLDQSHEVTLKGIADDLAVEFEIKDFTDVPLSVCLERDAKRSNSVGKKVIMGMYDRYLKPKLPVIVEDPNLPTVVICDLDGTLALHDGRSPYDTAKCGTDIVNKPVWFILENFTTIFVSGRSDEFRELTEEWLDATGHSKPVLFMRKAGDVRNDAIVKQEIYENSIKGHYNVLFVLDDRDRVVNMWREQGLTCLQVNFGDF